MSKGPQYTHFLRRPDQWKRPGETIDPIIGNHEHEMGIDEDQKENTESESKFRDVENRGNIWRLFTYALVIILIGDYTLLTLFILGPSTSDYREILMYVSGVILVFALVWAFKSSRYDKFGLLVVIISMVPFSIFLAYN